MALPPATLLDLVFHILLFIVAVVTPVIMCMAYARFSRGQLQRKELKTVVGYFALAYFFYALRWIGGSFLDLGFTFTDAPAFLFLWTLSGVLSAVFGLYAANMLYWYSRKK
jgi:hypothetical protein